MSLVPVLLDPYLERSSRLFDRKLGLALAPEDMKNVRNCPFFKNPIYPSIYYPWNLTTQPKNSSALVVDKEKFQLNLDVQQFAPDEISVKLGGKNTLIIEGKHEEKSDEHGLISRHFLRKIHIPDGYEINKLQSNLSSDGILSIMAPKHQESCEVIRTIPIQQTGMPVKLEEKKDIVEEKKEIVEEKKEIVEEKKEIVEEKKEIVEEKKEIVEEKKEIVEEKKEIVEEKKEIVEEKKEIAKEKQEEIKVASA